MLLVLTVLASPLALAYCNETVTVTHTNQTLASSDYTMNVTRACSPEYSTQSFGVVGGTLGLLIAGLILGLVFLKSNFTRILLALPLNILLVALLNFSRLFLATTNPEMAGALAVLDVLYTSMVVLLFPLLVITFWIAIKSISVWLLNPRAKKERDWQ